MYISTFIRPNIIGLNETTYGYKPLAMLPLWKKYFHFTPQISAWTSRPQLILAAQGAAKLREVKNDGSKINPTVLQHREKNLRMRMLNSQVCLFSKIHKPMLGF